MKIVNYLIQEAYEHQDWQLACSLISGYPELDVYKCDLRIFRDPENIPEIIFEHYDKRMRWSAILGKVKQEVIFTTYLRPHIIIFTNHC